MAESDVHLDIDGVFSGLVTEKEEDLDTHTSQAAVPPPPGPVQVSPGAAEDSGSLRKTSAKRSVCAFATG